MNEPVHVVKAGMGAISYESAVAFRVWAPHADRVFVLGEFNNWTESHPMQPGDNGTWYVEIPGAKIGDVLDVVYNHFGPGDLGLWKFDGWNENDGGGIYFYNDWRRKTPWGDIATPQDYDGCPARGSLDIGAYSLLIFSQDTEGGTNG